MMEMVLWMRSQRLSGCDLLGKHNLTHLNWAVSDKNEAASILTKGADPSGPWRPQDLTSSGKFVQKIIREW